VYDERIAGGTNWSNQLYSWLLDCSGAAVLIGKDPAQSEWSRREWFLRKRNRLTGIPIVPVSVDGTDESANSVDDLQALHIVKILLVNFHASSPD
jgi:hypothetical protein